MVRVQAENGSFYHEPPYTPEEEADFYRRTGNGPVAILKDRDSPHGKAPPKASAAPTKKSPPQPPEE